VTGSPEQPPEASLSVGEQVDEAVRTLTDQSAWMRDRLGEEDWQRLTRLRDAWVRCRQVSAGALRALKLAVVLVAAGAIAGLLARQPPAPDPSPIPYFFVLVPIALAAGWAGARIIEVLVSREMERLAWRGHSPEAVNRALWADLQAQLLAQGKPEVVAQARLQEESSQAPPWWRVELGGAHLVGWVALVIALVTAGTGWRAPGWLAAPAWATAACILLPKLVFWLLYRLTTSAAKLRRIRFYRWWARGPVPALVALTPGLFALLCLVLPAGD
jgi:uncharacterized membrane protein YhdT